MWVFLWLSARWSPATDCLLCGPQEARRLSGPDRTANHQLVRLRLAAVRPRGARSAGAAPRSTAAAAGPEGAAATPLAMAMSVIGTFSTTLVRADGVACTEGSRSWAETRQTSTTAGPRRAPSGVRRSAPLPGPDRPLARCPLSRDRGPGSGQGPSPRLTSRRARPVRGPSPRHRSRSAGLPLSRWPGTPSKLRNLRTWPFFRALAQYPATRSDLAGFRQPLSGARSDAVEERAGPCRLEPIDLAPLRDRERRLAGPPGVDPTRMSAPAAVRRANQTPNRRTAHADAARPAGARTPPARTAALAVPVVRMTRVLMPTSASAAVGAHSCRWRKGTP